jgi:hypothetical protein
LRIPRREDRRHDRLVIALPTAIDCFDFHLLNGASIRQEDMTQVYGLDGRKDRSFKSCQHQLWNQSAVIDMGVGQEHNVNLAWIERKRTVIELLQRLRSLKHATIHQDV